jgi:hypothetical protein
MVCDAGEIEAIKATLSCNPTRDTVWASLGVIDVWASRHTYLPFLLTMMTGNPWLAVTASYVYESIAVAQKAFGVPLWVHTHTPWGAAWTGADDGMLQDPGYGILGAVSAYVLCWVFEEYHDVTWNRTIEHWWVKKKSSRLHALIGASPMNCRPGWKRWGKRVVVNVLFFFGFARYFTEWITPWFIGEGPRLNWGYKWGSSNQMMAPLWVAGAVTFEIAAGGGGLSNKFVGFTVGVLAGPQFVMNVVGGVVLATCEATHGAKEDTYLDPTLLPGGLECSTFLWTWVALATYTALVGAAAHWRRRREEEDEAAGNDDANKPLLSGDPPASQLRIPRRLRAQ